jgi:hypothetical protein
MNCTPLSVSAASGTISYRRCLADIDAHHLAPRRVFVGAEIECRSDVADKAMAVLKVGDKRLDRVVFTIELLEIDHVHPLGAFADVDKQIVAVIRYTAADKVLFVVRAFINDLVFGLRRA